MTSLSAEITVGYIVTEVNVSESDGVAQLTVAITIPTEENPLETSFSLLVNTLDRTATGLAWILGLIMYSYTQTKIIA